MKTGSIKKLSIGRKDLFLLSPDVIHEDPNWNVRQENDGLKDHIRQLADSIKEIGVQQPLTVRMDGLKAKVTDGFCRMAAVRLAIKEGAEIKSVPVRTEERYSNEADHTLSMWVRNSGRQLTLPEQAEVVRRLLSFNWTEAEISRKTGSSRQHINNLVCFLSSPVEVQDMVKSGEVSATAAVNQVRKEGEAAAGTLKRAVVKANDEGKKRATARHMGKKDLIRPIENFAGKLPESEIDRAEEILELCKKLRGLVG